MKDKIGRLYYSLIYSDWFYRIMTAIVAVICWLAVCIVVGVLVLS